jgi:sulfatase maturation enzyme AslB (radical SAM superfamily)
MPAIYAAECADSGAKRDISIDTNGTQIHNYADELVRMGNIHLTFSVDGPEEIHDYIRGMKGCFATVKNNIGILRECERKYNTNISTTGFLKPRVHCTKKSFRIRSNAAPSHGAGFIMKIRALTQTDLFRNCGLP